jgi:hypothetical protein
LVLECQRALLTTQTALLILLVAVVAVVAVFQQM